MRGYMGYGGSDGWAPDVLIGVRWALRTVFTVMTLIFGIVGYAVLSEASRLSEVCTMETDATLVDARVERVRDNYGDYSYNVESLYSYTVGGNTYDAFNVHHGTLVVNWELKKIDKSVVIMYNPDDPSEYCPKGNLEILRIVFSIAAAILLPVTAILWWWPFGRHKGRYVRHEGFY